MTLNPMMSSGASHRSVVALDNDIEQQMQLHGALGAPVLRPVEDAGAEFDQGGVQAQQSVLEAEAMRTGSFAAAAQQLIKHGAVQLPGPMLVGIGQGGALGRIGQTQVPQLAFAGGQSAANLAQGLRPPQVTEQHGHELSPATEPASVALGPVLGDRLLELLAGKQLQHLAENAGYSYHGGGGPPYDSRLATQTVAEFYPRRSKPNLDKSDRDYSYDTKCYCCGAQPPGKVVLGVNVKQLFDLTARVAIVSGGSMGLGRQMAEGLAEMGANLVLCARKKERCEEAAEALRSLGVQTLALGCDVRDRAAIQEVVDATLAKFGRVDILVNNAGVSWGAPVEEMTLEQWDKVLSTNLTGTFLFCQAAGKAMVAQGSGKIINIASVAGLDGASAELQAIGYHASKAGVIAFTKDLACQWAPHNIQVNAIAPGWFPTHMSEWIIEHRKDSLLAKIPAGRFGGDHDLKGAAVFLASDASAYVTGHVLVVDGGLWAGKNKSL